MANDRNVPCADDSAQILDPTAIGPVTVDAANADTALTPDDVASRPAAEGDNATSTASVTNPVVALPGLNVSATVLSARASYTCQSGQPVAAGSSIVTNLVINGQTIALPPNNAPQVIDLGPLGSVRLNQTIQEPGRITQRALEIRVPADGSLTTIVIGEAIADFSVNPCRPAQCVDGVDNDGDGRVDAQDPGCLSGPGGTFNPNDDDESNPSTVPQCSDARDNDGDGRIDAQDPGCLSGPNGAFNPNDNDETNAVGAAQCSDARDNDGDGRIDAQDPGCLSGPNGAFNPNDNDERTPNCSDGIDNDRDGRIDFPADKGCTSASDNSEGTATGQARLRTDPAGVARGGVRGKCTQRSFSAIVSGRRIRSVVFSLDGRRIRTDRDSPFTARVSTVRPGTHRVTARVRFLQDSGTRARTLAFGFRRCANTVQAVRFTG